MEFYLISIPDYKVRKNITKIRTSSHSLEIEAGRYRKKNGKSIPVAERICKFCDDNLVEDEKHVIMVCKKYCEDRNTMVNGITDFLPEFKEKNTEQKFICLMSIKDIEVINILNKFLKCVQKKRGRI